ncbi:unnamed protein product [Didymodactylos carnosus]|uniref:Integrase catalytic domain-containing protein n=1 Tax=Didymodactylos carnosus TaxID=1234261 RepID=A0A815IGM2_9BILA|nr:unnamed protein product [Didymodactylos carnosus]CAF4243827.1 unnamed protein product [Didymodactylos carnosus]
MKLDAYDTVIKHRPGKANSNTDTLSRYPLKTELIGVLQSDGIMIGPLEERQEVAVNLWDSCCVLKDIKLAQRQDTDLRSLISFIQDDIRPDDEVLLRKLEGQARVHRVIDRKLYRIRKIEENSPLRNNLSPHLLVIPKSKRTELLQLAHDHPISGHLGRRKTLHRLSLRFHWDGMTRDVAHYVRSCDLCQRFKAANEKKAGLMQSHVVQSPWHTIGVDLTGPLPRTPRGSAYILVVVDYFTKWIELFPLKTIKSRDIAQLLHDEVIYRHGVPVEIVLDNGAQFVADIFRETLKIMGIRHRTTALYHPQLNLSERVNRTLKPMLAIFAQHDKKSWDLRLPQLALAIRAAINESTGQSPAFLMYGRELKLPLDLMYGPKADDLDELKSSEEARAYTERLKIILASAYQSARENLEIAQQGQKFLYDQHRKDVHFSEGDLVLMANASGSALGKWALPKLAPKWIGPFRIARKIGSLDYELVSLEDGAVLSPIHIERLQPYHRSSPVLVPHA